MIPLLAALQAASAQALPDDAAATPARIADVAPGTAG